MFSLANTIFIYVDDELGVVLEQYLAAAGHSYTVIYAGGLRTEKPQTYTAEFTDSGTGHAELKRELHNVNRNNRQDKKDRNLPLFEKYQFFTPGKLFFSVFKHEFFAVLYSLIMVAASMYC